MDSVIIYSDGKTYRLSIFEAKELYYKLRDMFDPNFHPKRDANTPEVIWR